MPSNTLHRDHRKIVRLVVGAILSFTVAIALPFVAPLALFPSSMIGNPESAAVVVDGQPLFRVADTAATASAADRANTISRGLQDFVQAQQQPIIDVEVTQPGELATVWLKSADSDPNEADSPERSFNFTVTADDTNDTLTPEAQADYWADTLREAFTQAKEQRQDNYIQRHMWKVVAAAIAAALGHWLSGILWRKYLRHFLQLAMMEDDDDPGSFTPVSLFLNATLLLLRSGIWIGALLYATNLFPDTRQFSYRLISQLTDAFSAKTIPLGNAPLSILDIFRVLILVLLVTIAARVVSNLLKQRILQETGINRGVQEAIAILMRYGFIFIGTIVVLQVSGINLSSLTLLASALGVGAGLGLQNIVKDIGSGLVLVFERPVQVGEFVQMGDHLGTIERIGARSSEIRTLDQVSIIVPNSQFLENEVINWSHRNPISRLRIPVDVAYKSDPVQVREVLLRVGHQHPDVLEAPPTQVLFSSFGESALQFELLVWVSQPSRQFIIKSDLLFMLTKALRKEDIEIPFPQRDVHVVWQDIPRPQSDPSAENAAQGDRSKPSGS
ncbi:MAG: mechanosensitive ion channel domain-containing protein [Phormidesmis sp.]